MIPLPEVRRRETVYQGYFDVYIDHLHLHHGPSLPYTCIDLKVHAAAVLAQTKEGKFIINKEYRHPTKQWLLSCPGGRIDTGESPLEAGMRELLEETGYSSSECHLLGNTYPLPALTDQRLFYVFAKDAEFVKAPTHEPFELIHTELKSEQELMQEIASGVPVDGILCTALLLYKMGKV